MAEKKSGLLSWLAGSRADTQRAVQVPVEEQAQLAPHSPLLPLTERLEDKGEIGRGAMASVRLVRDRNLLRQAAMKVLDPRIAGTPGEIERFVEEAQITGQLDHPNVPPVYEVGVDEEGTHYFLMKYVQGRTFEDSLHPGAFSVRNERQLFTALQVLLKACEAVSFAHSRGVIHCDLKPANLMVGKHGEVYVMDWGISRLIQREDGRSRSVQIGFGATRSKDDGKVMGSLGYMSPEQARGRNDELDERTDVFALGAILYRVLTGRPPYLGNSIAELLEKAAAARWVAPAELAPHLGLPRRLCAICARAMAPDPAERHPTAGALRDDLEAFLSGPGRVPTRTYPIGHEIVREGDPGESAFAIESGRCRVYKTVDGHRQVIREMGPGDVFGEMAVLTKQPRTATVEAIEEVKVAVLGASTLAQDLGQTTWMGPLLKALAARFEDVDRRAGELQRELAESKVREAVMAYLALRAETAPDGSRRAAWGMLCQTLMLAFGLRRDEVLAATRRMEGLFVDPEEDLVQLGGTARRSSAAG